ncbi:ImmA/IrrE family metallo-endopeptidase [Arthrobacter sp. HLT1-21]
MYDPWQDVESNLNLEVVLTLLPEGMAGCTDGQTIYMEERLTAREQRCVLTHELVHVFAGHTGTQPETVEESVRQETARILISHEALSSTLRRSRSVAEIAEDLDVTVLVLKDRAKFLSPLEQHCIEKTQDGRDNLRALRNQ